MKKGNITFFIHICSPLLPKGTVREKICFSSEFVRDEKFPSCAAKIFETMCDLVQKEIKNKLK